MDNLIRYIPVRIIKRNVEINDVKQRTAQTSTLTETPRKISNVHELKWFFADITSRAIQILYLTYGNTFTPDATPLKSSHSLLELALVNKRSISNGRFQIYGVPRQGG